MGFFESVTVPGPSLLKIEFSKRALSTVIRNIFANDETILLIKFLSLSIDSVITLFIIDLIVFNIFQWSNMYRFSMQMILCGLFFVTPVIHSMELPSQEMMPIPLNEANVQMNGNIGENLVNATAPLGDQNALYEAAIAGNVQGVTALLQNYRFDVNAPASNYEGFTPLYAAAQQGHEEVVRVLIGVPGIRINQRYRDSYTPLHTAADFGRENIVRLLLTASGIEGNSLSPASETPLYFAAKAGHAPVVKAILERAAVMLNPTVSHYIECAPVPPPSTEEISLNGVQRKSAGSYDRNSLYEAVRTENIEEVKSLLKSPGIDVNAQIIDGMTALYTAAYYGYDAIVQLLLIAPGIDINIACKEGYTPLHAAAANGHENVVRMLIAVPHIKINARTSELKTALTLAALHKREGVVKLLVANDAIILDQVSSTDEIAVQAQELILRFFNSARRMWPVSVSRMPTPLHAAITHGHDAVVKLLLRRYGINVNILNEKDELPLYIALNQNPLNVPMIQELLYHGCIVDINHGIIDILRKVFGDNPLIMAVIFNNHEAIPTLIRQSDSMSLKQALWFAMGQGRIKVVESMLPFINKQLADDALQHVTVLLRQELHSFYKKLYKRILCLFDAEKRDEECLICMERFYDTPDMKANYLGCGHKYHGECIKPLLEHAMSCPTCRMDNLNVDFLKTVLKRKLQKMAELLSAGASINFEINNVTLLEMAINEGDFDKVAILLENYRLPDPIKDLQKCLSLAAKKALESKDDANRYFNIMMALIIQGALVDLDDNVLSSAIDTLSKRTTGLPERLMIAIICGNHQEIMNIINSGKGIIFDGPLLVAISQGRMEMVKLLMKELIKGRNMHSKTEEFGEFAAFANGLKRRCAKPEYKVLYQEIEQFISHHAIIRHEPVMSIM